MIIGLGSDLCDIRRIEKSLETFSTRFERKCFTDKEIAKAHARAKKGNNSAASTFAKRFAAKEACAKALGTGLSNGVFWKDMEVVNLPSGKPTIALTNGALSALERITPNGKEAHIHVSLCDEYPYAQAFVVIEAE